MLKELAKNVHDKATEEYGNVKVGILSKYIAESIVEILDKDFDNTEAPISDASVRRFLLKYSKDKEKISDPSMRTINQLARYIGYESYVHFISWHNENKSNPKESKRTTIVNQYGPNNKHIDKLEGGLTINNK